MYPDPLSVAVAVVHAHLDDIGWLSQPGWRQVEIYRLLSGHGWLVSSTQTSIILDKWMEKAA